MNCILCTALTWSTNTTTLSKRVMAAVSGENAIARGESPANCRAYKSCQPKKIIVRLKYKMRSNLEAQGTVGTSVNIYYSYLSLDSSVPRTAHAGLRKKFATFIEFFHRNSR